MWFHEWICLPFPFSVLFAHIARINIMQPNTNDFCMQSSCQYFNAPKSNTDTEFTFVCRIKYAGESKQESFIQSVFFHFVQFILCCVFVVNCLLQMVKFFIFVLCYLRRIINYIICTAFPLRVAITKWNV